MTTIIIKLILIILAAICKAAADTVHHHPLTSRLNGKFWRMWPHDKFILFTNIPFDGWHCANGAMICLFIAIPFVDLFLVYAWYWVIGMYILTGITAYVLPFNLFYNKILQKK